MFSFFRYPDEEEILEDDDVKIDMEQVKNTAE